MNEKETITTTFQMPVLDKHWGKTFALMLISVIMMGLWRVAARSDGNGDRSLLGNELWNSPDTGT